MEELTHDEYWNLFSSGFNSLATSQGLVTVVAKYDHYMDSYGEGVEQDAWMVLRLNGKTYKKYGWADSYGSVAWDGGLKEVKPTIKTIEVWE